MPSLIDLLIYRLRATWMIWSPSTSNTIDDDYDVEEGEDLEQDEA